MSSHIAHAPTLEVGLVDGCPRCEEHADAPLRGLDKEHLAAFWRQMLAVEWDDPLARYRSENEARACTILYEHAIFLRSLGIDPRTVTPGVPIIRRPEALAVATLVERILDRITGEPFALTITRDVVEDCSVSCSWGAENDDVAVSFGSGDDVVTALSIVAAEMGA